MRVMLCSAIILLITAIFAVFLPLWVIVIAIALSVCGVLAFSFIKASFAKKGAVICFFVAAALSVFLLKTLIVVDPLEEYSGSEVEIEGMISSSPQKSSMGFSYVLDIKEINGEKRSGKIKLLSTAVLGKRGEEIKVTSSVDKIENTVFYTDRFYSFGKGIFLTGEVSSFEKTGENKLRKFFFDLSDKMSAEISKNLPEREGDLLSGVLLNDKDKLSAEDKATLSGAGYSHLINVSGLHMSMISALIFFVFRKLLLGRRRLASFFAIFGVIFYMVLTGFSVSAVRSGIMLIASYVAYMRTVEADGLNSLGFAVTLILLFNPFAAYDVSLLLSASSTFGIIYVGSYITNLHMAEKISVNLYRFLLVAAPSFAAVLFSGIVVMFCYGQLNLISPISNIALLAFATPFVYTGVMLLTSSLLGIPVLTEFLALLVSLLAKVIFFLGEVFSKPDFLTVKAAGVFPKIAVVILIAVLPVIFARRFTIKKKKILSACLFVAFLVSIGLSIAENSFRNRWSLYVLVGEGGYSYICGKDGEYYVFGVDTPSMAYSVTRFLSSRGEDEIEVVYVSANTLHKKNALRSLSSSFSIEKVYADSEETLLSLEETYSIKGRLYSNSPVISFTGKDNVTISNENADIYINLSEKGEYSAKFVTKKGEEGVFYLAKSGEKVYYRYNGISLSGEVENKIYRLCEKDGKLNFSEVRTLGTDS